MVRLIAALMVCLCVVPVANAQSAVDPRRVALDHLAKRITVETEVHWPVLGSGWPSATRGVAW